jgi:hypothetical protein
MLRSNAVAILVALTGCAGIQTVRQHDVAAGHWIGEVDRDGWSEPLAVDIEGENGVYRGQWRLASGLHVHSLESVEVQGDEVRFETEKLRFVGHVSGDTLAGTVARKPAGETFAEFAVKNDGEKEVYSPASEWAPAIIDTTR